MSVEIETEFAYLYMLSNSFSEKLIIIMIPHGQAQSLHCVLALAVEPLLKRDSDC